MKLLIVSETFPDADAQALRDARQKVNCVRDVAAAQRALKDGFQPQSVYIDNSLTGAQYFAKQVKSMFPEVRVFMVAEKEITLEASGQWGIEEFVKAPLTIEEIMARTPESTKKKAQEEEGVIELSTLSASEGEKEARRNALREHVEGMVAKAKSAFRHEKRGGGEGKRGKDKRFTALYRLSFPAIVGALTAALLMGVLVHRPAGESARVVPNLYGISVEHASWLLESENVPFEVVDVPAEEDAGMVLSQFPPAGTPVDEVEKVTLLVAQEKGPAENVESAGEAGEQAQTQEAEASVTGESIIETLPVRGAQAQEVAEAPVSKRPVAVISASRTSGPSSGFIVNFDASGSYDPDGGRIVSYAWSFGGSGAHASHEFVSDTAPRAFMVTLTVTDDEGESGMASVEISAI